MKKEKILVTGGTGYIGSHTVVELQNNGYEVIIVDNLSNSSLEVLDGIASITGKKPDFEQIDCCDMSAMERIFNQYSDIKAIIHFAASKAVGESVEKPLMYYRNNLVSLLNILELMSKYNCPNLVFSSSCTVYGQPDKLPVTEDAPVKAATSPYGNTKQIAEEIIRDAIHADKNLKSIALRYFNPVGAHPSAAIGELPNGIPNNLIPFVTQTAIGIRSRLRVFGSDYNTPDGSAIRDYIYVSDLAKAHVIAVERLLENRNRKGLEFFNLGTGRGLSVLEVLNEFEKATGVKVEREIVGRREGDIEKVWADPSWANSELGWKAETSVSAMLQTAWTWEKALKNKK
ncbi:MAG: UDP-glucose 4-epimerase GalE [Prevotellaceae bacterium]|jgi:UDP-glucose 4-epimerase|nr:UDP-glucose 4-epimerase GalE [Prevotellaceae bacterium]